MGRSSLTRLQAARARYLEQIEQAEAIAARRVLRAFSAVPRERFFGGGPWRTRKDGSSGYRLTATADPVHLYHDRLVAIDARRRLDCGLPSLWAHFFDVLRIRPGERVVQIGCGLGYYAAVLSEIVGGDGSVVAIECDRQIAERARKNLSGYGNVEVICGDGARAIPGRADVLVVHAGFPEPHPLWLRSLRPGGRLLLPLTGRDRGGSAILIARHGRGYVAEAVRGLRIFPGAGRAGRAKDDRMAESWERACAAGPYRFTARDLARS